jgi:hypothetical protein
MGYALLSIALSRSATERALDASEILILLCGLILAMGAAGEYIEEHGTLPRWMKWSRRPKMVFVWMVALSLVGEFVGDAGVFVFSGHLQTMNDGEYAALNKEAGDARRDAGNAMDRAGKLEQEAAALRKQVEDEDFERVKIEDAVAWRRLTKDQISKLGTELSVFPRQLTALIHNVGDLEAYSFASDIDVALHEFAKWNIGEPQAVLMMREGPVNFRTNPPLERGVVVNSTSDEQSRSAAKAVVDNLSILGFDAVIGAPISQGTRPTVQIIVEPRPEGPQGAAKLRAQNTKKRP